MPRLRSRRALALCTVAALAVSACGDGDADETSDAAVTEGADGDDAGEGIDEDASTAGVVDNCGIELEAGQPERIFAVYHGAIEMAHALGVSDRLVATAYLDNTILPEFADLQEGNEFFEAPPSREELLRLDPDFVLSGYNAFTPEGLGTRGELTDIGIDSYLFSQVCPVADGETELDVDEVSLELTFQEIRDIGLLLGAEEAAEDVVAEMQQVLDDVAAAVDGAERPRVAMVNPGSEGFGVGGRDDITRSIVELAGGEYVFADLPGHRNRVQVEEIIARDPEVIFTWSCCADDLEREDAEDNLAQLRDNAQLANVAAIRDDRLFGVTFAEVSLGVRNADAVAHVAEQIHPDRF